MTWMDPLDERIRMSIKGIIASIETLESQRECLFASLQGVSDLLREANSSAYDDLDSLRATDEQP